MSVKGERIRTHGELNPAGKQFQYSELSKGVWGIVDPFGESHKIHFQTEEEVLAWIDEFQTNPEKMRASADATE